MAAPALRRGAWIGGAVLAGAALLALALHGERPEPGLARYEPKGPMVHLAPDRVTEVEVTRGGRAWRFARSASGGWQPAAGPRSLAADSGEAIDLGLRFLHGSTPQRILAHDEWEGTPLAEFGLAPPRLVVAVPGPEPFAIEIGGLNAQGLGRYARIRGRDELLLLDRHVAEAWERVVPAP